MSTVHLNPADNNVRGRLALVTGASAGIGEAAARALAAEGCDVVLHYSRSKDLAASVAASLSAEYPDQTFTTVYADLACRESTRNLVPATLALAPVAARGHKAVSILVANAAAGRRIRDPEHISEDDWDEMLEVNSRAQFVVARACLGGMRPQRWGRIVLIGSIASRGGGINGCHYAASKGALASMGLNLATVLAPEGITVNVIQPGMIVPTGMVPTPKGSSYEAGCDMDKLREEDPGLAIASTVPVRRPGQTYEVGNLVATFAKTGYITGQEVVISGGLK